MKWAAIQELFQRNIDPLLRFLIFYLQSSRTRSSVEYMNSSHD